MKNRGIILLIITLFCSTQLVFSQPPARGGFQGNMPNDAKLTGSIIDASNNQGVEYASVAIYRQKDSTLVTGVMSTTNGAFTLENLPYGKFYLEINFVGYKKQRVPDILLIPNKKVVALGVVKIDPSTTAIKEVEVLGAKSNIEYRIDKKVVDVSQNAIAQGGTVVDALQNTPSIQTDVEGNVTLRGSSNFTVLIDGKPSPISGSEALQQIPASIVQSVEIITNPSAKFEAEGASGIINVIMKKQKMHGMNGVVNLTGGTGEKYRGDINFNFRRDKFNYSLGADFADMKFNAKSYSNNIYDYNLLNGRADSIKNQEINGTGGFHRQGFGFKGGIDYTINSKNTISLTGSVGARTFSRPFNSSYHDILTYQNVSTNSYYLNYNTGEYQRNYYNLNLDYQLKIDDKGQQFSASAYLAQGPENNTSNTWQDVTDLNWNSQHLPTNILNTAQDGNETEVRGKLDYVLPIGEKGKLETGYQGRYNETLGTYHLYNNDVEDKMQLDKINFKDNIQAAYVSYSNSTNIVDFMVGLRTEYEYRNFTQRLTKKTYIMDRAPDLFPSVHVSKQLPWNLQVQGSFTRRINRPRDWSLDPLVRPVDPQTVRYGNAYLKPEFTNSYELNLQKKLNDASFFSVEGFLRQTNNKIQQITVPGIIKAMTFDNLDFDRSLGAEFMLNLVPNKWFTFNASSSIYHYLVVKEQLTKTTNTWNLRINPSVRFSKGPSIQFSYQYNGPSLTSQGTNEGNYSTSLGIRQDILKRKGSLTLQLRDFIGNEKFANTTDIPTFYSYNYFKRETKVVMLTFSYRINNYKAQQAKRNPEDLNNGGQEGDINGGGF